jgi:hypothetical protein
VPYLSRAMLALWDFVAAVQFVWCHIVPRARSLPCKKAWLPLYRFMYRHYEIPFSQEAGALLIAARKNG